MLGAARSGSASDLIVSLNGLGAGSRSSPKGNPYSRISSFLSPKGERTQQDLQDSSSNSLFDIGAEGEASFLLEALRSGDDIRTPDLAVERSASSRLGTIKEAQPPSAQQQQRPPSRLRSGLLARSPSTLTFQYADTLPSLNSGPTAGSGGGRSSPGADRLILHHLGIRTDLCCRSRWGQEFAAFVLASP